MEGEKAEEIPPDGWTRKPFATRKFSPSDGTFEAVLSSSAVEAVVVVIVVAEGEFGRRGRAEELWLSTSTEGETLEC